MQPGLYFAFLILYAALCIQLKGIMQPLGNQLLVKSNENIMCSCGLVKNSWLMCITVTGPWRRKGIWLECLEGCENNQFPSQLLARPPQYLPWSNLSTVQKNDCNQNDKNLLLASREFICALHKPHTARMKVQYTSTCGQTTQGQPQRQ